jgi:hypothetical protein
MFYDVPPCTKNAKFRLWRKIDMKQKYVVLLDGENGRLAIQEYAELDKEMLSLLCEESYDAETIKAAMEKNRNALIQALRTHNMYPPGVYTERIADAIVEMFQPGANTSAELFFEERELFEPLSEEPVDDDDSDDDDDDGMDVDELLDDDIDDDFEEKGIIKNLKKTIKIADADSSIDDA